MYDQTEIDQRLVIIKHSGLDDVVILDENYRHLMWQSTSPEEKKQFEVLRSNVQRRLKELRVTHGEIGNT